MSEDPLHGLDNLRDALKDEPGTEIRASKFVGIAAAECVIARMTLSDAVEIFSRTFARIDEEDRRKSGGLS